MTARPHGSRVRHGDPTCAYYGCRRPECLRARQTRRKRNQLLRFRGQPFLVDSERAAAHISRFRAAGLMDKEIMVRLSVGRPTFYRITRGERITRDTERAVLSVPAPQPAGEVRSLTLVDATGTCRRYQALAWLGWPPSVLESRLGVPQGWMARRVRLRQKRVTLMVEARARALYDELWNVRPEDAGVPPRVAERARVASAKAGYLGPLAWDDDTIDDPGAVPRTDAEAPAVAGGGRLAARWLMGESVVLDRESRDEVIAYLYEWTNETTAEIAGRLEMRPNTVEQTWSRIKRKARESGGPVPWRRVYVPRERTLKKDDMEEAA